MTKKFEKCVREKYDHVFRDRMVPQAQCPSNRGISVPNSGSRLNCWVPYPPFVFKDLANRIRWSKQYLEAIAEAGVEAGRILSPEAGEWFSGLPLHWTNLTPGLINVSNFNAAFPYARTKAR